MVLRVGAGNGAGGPAATASLFSPGVLSIPASQAQRGKRTKRFAALPAWNGLSRASTKTSRSPRFSVVDLQLFPFSGTQRQLPGPISQS